MLQQNQIKWQNEKFIKFNDTKKEYKHFKYYCN